MKLENILASIGFSAVSVALFYWFVWPIIRELIEGLNSLNGAF